MNVQVIEASKPGPGSAPASGPHHPLRVAAYCRVSTASDEQESSYAAQVRHYGDYIGSHPGWVLAGIYADRGISGTSTRHREQFQRMLRDCEAGLIDRVVTKSISRWARNTVDALRSIRRLRDLGIPVLFEKEGIDTMDAQGEVLITIMSSLAQQESDSISRNVRMGIQYQMQQGKGRLNTSRFLGYDKGGGEAGADPGERPGALRVVPAEARLVRRIYRAYLEGYSPGAIARQLTDEGIPAPSGGATWYQSTTSSILENEKYCGDLLMQKYYVADFLTHRIERNTGQLPQYFVEDAHEPIVPKEVWRQVQGEIARRSALQREPARIRFGSAEALRGRLVCGRCGRALKRCVRDEGTGEPGTPAALWACRKRAIAWSGGELPLSDCACRSVPEAEAQQAVLDALNQALGMRAELASLLVERERRARGAAGPCAAADAGTEIPGPKLASHAEPAAGTPAQLGAATDENAVQPGPKSAPRAEPAACTPAQQGAVALKTADAGTELPGPERPPSHQHVPSANATAPRPEALAPDEGILEQATWAHAAMQARMLLELAEVLAELAHGQASATVPDPGPCHDSDDFYRRTRYLPDPRLVGANGQLVAFSDSLVTRYLERVTVLDAGYHVRLRCGLELRVGIPRPHPREPGGGSGRSASPATRPH